MRKALDFSNYDSNVPFNAWAVATFRGEGFTSFIQGCQRIGLALSQAKVAVEGGMECIGVYVEPFTAADAYQATIDGITVARQQKVEMVWAACEKGGVTGIDELWAIRGQVEAAGLRFGVYSGRPTWFSLFGNTTEFSDCPLWFPAYWSDGHITSDLEAEGWAFGGWRYPHIHQYASTPELAGRNRDRNVVIIEEEGEPMSPLEEARVARLEALLAGNGIDPKGDGKLVTGNEALEYAFKQGWSAFLGVGLARQEIAAHELIDHEPGGNAGVDLSKPVRIVPATPGGNP